MKRTLRTKLPVSPSLLQPVVIDAREQVVARHRQQKEVYDRTAKPVRPPQLGEVVRMHHGGESQRAIIRHNTNTPRSYIVETQDDSKLRRNRRHYLNDIIVLERFNSTFFLLLSMFYYPPFAP